MYKPRLFFSIRKYHMIQKTMNTLRFGFFLKFKSQVIQGADILNCHVMIIVRRTKQVKDNTIHII